MKQLQPYTGLRCHHQLVSQMQVTAGEPEPAPCRLPGGSSQGHWQGRGGCKADFSGGTLLGVKHLPSPCTQHKLTEQKSNSDTVLNSLPHPVSHMQRSTGLSPERMTGGMCWLSPSHGIAWSSAVLSQEGSSSG